ncbi:hypothetical protein LWF01_08860 [Saxibacter everestensis]|uniref:HTTM domain-containing protein n=1 Tax=Saxibacter everestensis TaxID=2909229 RepID=A0ABY8QYH2_9MICO|nr:hypothetical protein LWF01_08860 [Brevibacteriaceae bacterium ZFBP1038]
MTAQDRVAATGTQPDTRSAFRRWAAPLVPLERIAIFRTFIYLFLIANTFFILNDPPALANVPADLYQPIILRQVLHLPAPNVPYVTVLHIVLVVSALIAASGRLPRIAGTVALLAFVDWATIGYSFTKVDHDQYAFFVTLLVLPLAGQAKWGDRTLSEAAGFTLRAVHVGVVLCYFLSAWAKMRYGGWGWANKVVIGWAFARRGTDFAQWLLTFPWFPRFGQWLMLIAEFGSPILLFLRKRWLAVAVLFFCGFHLFTFLTLEIHFLPLVICLLSFAPLEKVFGIDSRLGQAITSRRPT